MARFLAMRCANHKLEYADVPEKYKQEVKQLLMDEYGWKEDDFSD